MPDPIGGRRRDDPSDIGAAVPVMSPWDLVFERLDRLERTQSDVARMVLQIHEALPAVTGFAVGQGLALGSPIDSRNSISSTVPPPPPPIIGIPPPQRIDSIAPAHAAYSEPEGLHLAAPDFVPPLAAIPEPPPFGTPPPPPPGFAAPASTPIAELTGFDLTTPEPKAGKLFGRRKAKRAAADRNAIASLLASPPPPPPGFAGPADHGSFSLDSAVPPPPPPGFAGPADSGAPPPPPGGFSFDAPPPPPPGFAGPAGHGSFSLDAAAPPPPPPGFGGTTDYAQIVPIAPPPGGFAIDSAMFTPPPLGLTGVDSPPPPPPGFAPGAEPWLAQAQPVEAPSPAAPAPPPGFSSQIPVVDPSPVPPPPGYAQQIPVVDPSPVPPPPGYAPTRSAGEPFATPLPPLQLDQHQAPPPPPGFGRPSEMANDLAAAMTPAEGFGGGMHDMVQSMGAGTEGEAPNLVTVPPITPDFFARSGRRRR